MISNRKDDTHRPDTYGEEEGDEEEDEDEKPNIYLSLSSVRCSVGVILFFPLRKNVASEKQKN